MSKLQPKVALGDGFLQAFAAIPRAQQKAVMSFVSKFRANPRATGINYEVIRNARDPNFSFCTNRSKLSRHRLKP